MAIITNENTNLQLDIKDKVDALEDCLEYKNLIMMSKCAVNEARARFENFNVQFNAEYEYNPIDNIETRIKTTESIVGKLKKKGLPIEMGAIYSNVSDIAGIRIICSFVDDIYKLADAFLQQEDVSLLKRKDYIKSPKNGGYRSLHLIVEIPIYLTTGKKLVKVEVQLRTIAMDFWASLEHKIRYKKALSPEQLQAVEREVIDCSNVSANLDERMQNVRDVILQSET